MQLNSSPHLEGFTRSNFQSEGENEGNLGGSLNLTPTAPPRASHLGT